MRIASSMVAMTSTHQESKHVSKQSMTMNVPVSNGFSGFLVSTTRDRQSKQLAQETQGTQKMGKSARIDFSESYKFKSQMLRQLFEILNQSRRMMRTISLSETQGMVDFRSPFYQTQEIQDSIQDGSGEQGMTGQGTMEVGTTGFGTLWQRVNVTSSFFTETESTTFASKGIVKTADGRSIDFNIQVSMSSEFVSQMDMISVENYVLTDPLMINLDTPVGSVSDQKFFFDLDADGEKEEISFAGKGSGFLALDKNGDGIINDGSELFGTKSGDGFRDLAAYDSDENGWIDENDEIFSKLRVWTKDEDGKDILMSLKDADVGAIYLSNVDSQFSLRDASYNMNGMLRKTGLFLRESTGAAGTINHVDLRISGGNSR